MVLRFDGLTGGEEDENAVGEMYVDGSFDGTAFCNAASLASDR